MPNKIENGAGPNSGIYSSYGPMCGIRTMLLIAFTTAGNRIKVKNYIKRFGFGFILGNFKEA